MSGGDALSGADGTQSPGVGDDPLRAEPAPHTPLPALDLPQLPALPSLPALGEQLGTIDDDSTFDAPTLYAPAHDAASTEHPTKVDSRAPDRAPVDEVPTPPEWPAVTPADIPPPAAGPPATAPPATAPPATVPPPPPPPPPAERSAPSIAPTAALPMPPQQPTRPARPTIRDAEPSLLGLTKRSRTRVGQLAFTAVFAVIFVVILVQLVISLLTAR